MAQRRNSNRQRRDRAEYSAAVRESAVAAARESLAAGESVTAVAREMALPLTTLQRWLARDTGRLRRVTIADVAPISCGGLVVVTAGGHRVEGLDLAGVIALLRGLETAA